MVLTRCLPGVRDCLQPFVWCIYQSQQNRQQSWSPCIPICAALWKKAVVWAFVKTIFNYILFLPFPWKHLLILPPVPNLCWVGFESIFLMAWNQSTCSERGSGVIPPDLKVLWDKYSRYASGGVGSFLLFLRRRGIVPFVVPMVKWGCSFCYASGRMGFFLLLCLRRIGVFPFIPMVAWVLSFCYASRGMVFGLIGDGSSQSAWFCFDRRCLVLVRGVLFWLALACRSQVGLVPVVSRSL